MPTCVNEYEVTRKLYLQWVLEAKKSGKHLAFVIFWCLLTIVCLVLSWIFGWDPYELLLTFFCAFMVLPRDIILALLNFKKVRSRQGGSAWTRCITVTADEITVNDGINIATFKTAGVTKVTQDDMKLRVFIKNGGSLRLYKNAFTQGTWQDCLSLLAK